MSVRLSNFTSSWDLGIFREYWIPSYQGHDAIFGAVYAHKGRTKKLQHNGLHGFALDQPSINGIGPIHCSEKWKRSETVGNMIRPKLVQPEITFQKEDFCATHFFLKVQRCPRGNGWKQSEIAPSLGKNISPALNIYSLVDGSSRNNFGGINSTE